MDMETAKKLQSCEGDNQNNIVRVEGELRVFKPPSQESSRGWEETERERDRKRHGGAGGLGSTSTSIAENGLEEILCTMRLQEQSGNPSRADVYTEQAGFVSSINSYNLPILYWLQLSAERGLFHKNAIMAPHYHRDCHSVIYVIRGSTHIQIVDDNGQIVFDGKLSEGQLLVVPQNFVVVKKAENQEFEWVSFKTTDNSMISPLAGRNSVLRALPEEVIANAYQMSRQEAKQLKYDRQQSTILRCSECSGSSGGPGERRAEA